MLQALPMLLLRVRPCLAVVTVNNLNIKMTNAVPSNTTDHGLLSFSRVNMIERKLFILEPYYTTRDGNQQMWRVTNPGGLGWYANISEYTFIPPDACRIGVVEQISAVQAFLESSGDKW